MKRLNFALVSDVLFFTLCAFIISFACLRFFIKSIALAVAVSAAIALVTGATAFTVLLDKRKKRLALTLDESEKKSLALHLSVCGEKYVRELFLKALDGTYVGGNHVEDEENVYFFNFKMAPLSADDIAAVIKCDSQKRKRIFCCSVCPEALSLAEDFEVTVTGIGEIYVLLKDKELLPEKYALGKVKKPSVLEKIKRRFNRRLSPSLFFSGFALIFFSFFTFYPVYYVAAGGVLTLLSAVTVLINPKKG